MVINYLAVKEIVDCAKRVSSHIITIIGGGLVTHSPEESMELIPNADYGVIGEGEITDSELVLTLESGGDPAQVAGIIYRDGDALRRTKPRAPIDDLDALPWPDYEGFHYFEVAKRLSASGMIAAALTTSRSCPFQCTFCSTSGGGKYRQRSLGSIFAELKYLVDSYGVNKVFLNDELFAVDETRLHGFCQRIAPFHNLRPDIIILQQYESEIFDKISRNGCALWGMTARAHDVYWNITRFRNAEGLILLDRNQRMQKTGFYGKTVMSPERILELGVNKVFCLVSDQNLTEIKKKFEGTSVRVINFNEILFED